MIEVLKHIDQTLFLLINQWHSPVIDELMWAVSGKWIWVPWYLFLLFLLIKYSNKHWKWYVLAIALIVVSTDQLSVHCFKEVFLRYRPSHNILLQNQVHIVHQYRGGLYGFVSSHAANTMGVVFFLILIIRKRWFIIVNLLWVFLIGYSRIYLGVHYPLDIIGGWLLGVAVAYGFYRFVSQYLKSQVN